MNNNDRINLIQCVGELEGLTDRERSALPGLLRADKAYGLAWEDKPEAVEERMREELPVLREVPERALVSDCKDAPDHILIEGDNLEALAALAYTHAGRIFISIDDNEQARLKLLLVYKKTEKSTRNSLPRTEKQSILYKYDSSDGKGKWRPDNLSVRTYSTSYDYPIINPLLLRRQWHHPPRHDAA